LATPIDHGVLFYILSTKRRKSYDLVTVGVVSQIDSNARHAHY